MLLTIFDLAITQDFLPLPLGSANVILGVAWLETLGKIEIDYRTSVMVFSVGKSLVQLQGDRSLVKSQVSFKSMMKSLQKEDEGLLIELSAMVVSTSEAPNPDFTRAIAQLLEGIQEVLHFYEQVFMAQPSLPPSRAQDHAIELEVGTQPVNVRPY